MGIYATTTSIETYWVGSSFEGLTALASAVIEDAEDEVKKMLSRRYDVSTVYFTDAGLTPAALENITKFMAIGMLYEATARGGKEAYQRADRYLKKAKDNIEDLLQYKAQLVDSSGNVIGDAADQMQVISSTTDYSETFNEDSELNWAVDLDKLDDIDSERD